MQNTYIHKSKHLKSSIYILRWYKNGMLCDMDYYGHYHPISTAIVQFKHNLGTYECG